MQSQQRPPERQSSDQVRNPIRIIGKSSSANQNSNRRRPEIPSNLYRLDESDLRGTILREPAAASKHIPKEKSEPYPETNKIFSRNNGLVNKNNRKGNQYREKKIDLESNYHITPQGSTSKPIRKGRARWYY